MRKHAKRVIAVILAFVMLLSLPLAAAAAEKAYADRSPIIIMPGIGQSKTIVYDEDGNYLAATNEFDLGEPNIKELIRSAAVPAIRTLISRKDEQLSQAAYDVITELLRAFRKNTDGTPVYRTEVKEFNLPYAQLSAEDRAEIDSHITLDGLAAYNDIRYYFTYDCFGSVKEAADRLHEYVHMVLEQTGAKKVNIVPVSQAGAVFVEYLDLYPEDHCLLDRVVGFVAAYDGSVIVGDVLSDHVNLYDINYLHETILPGLLGNNDTTYAISLALRAALPSEVLVPVLKSALRAVLDCLAINNTLIWALCPDAAYEEAAARLLCDGEHDFIKAEVDRFMLARDHFEENLNDLIAGGTVIHNVVSYDVPVFMSFLFEHSDTDTDDLLHVASPSIGAVAALHGDTLSEDYIAADARCTDPAHNHRSADGKIDASTCYLPENTWFFKGVSHMGLNNRNDVKDIAIRLMTDDDIKDIYTFEGQGQFLKLPDYEQVREGDQICYYNNGELVYTKTAEKTDEGGFSLLRMIFDLVNVIFRFKEAASKTA